MLLKTVVHLTVWCFAEGEAAGFILEVTCFSRKSRKLLVNKKTKC
jgi:hypothetical protein